jgi:quercetin dioxygenase-like cupin family protein
MAAPEGVDEKGILMKRLILLTLPLLLAGSAAQAQMNPSQLKWGPAPAAFPKGAQMAVLSGDPGKEGMSTVRLRFPAGYTIAAHQHPTDELVTVINGQMSLGMGDKLDRAKSASLIQGGYAVAPAKMNHYAFTRGGATVQVTFHGPFAMTYVDPKDDPRNK